MSVPFRSNKISGLLSDIEVSTWRPSCCSSLYISYGRDTTFSVKINLDNSIMLDGHEFVTKLQDILGFRPLDVDIYLLAFTHKSASSQSTEPIKSYDRLEFIGDAVINWIVAMFLYFKYPEKPEGYMTRLRTKLVSGKCLSHISKCLNLQQFIRMNVKAINNGWNCNDRILEDVFEALVAAIALDRGLHVAESFVLSSIYEHVPMDMIETEDNFKDILMRHTQAIGVDLPVYDSVENFEHGRRQYEVTVRCKLVTTCECQAVGFGVAFTKKKAEQEAACHALQKLRARHTVATGKR